MIRKFYETQKTRLSDWQKAIAQVRKVYFSVHGRAPNIFRPRRFTEKMQWRKLFDDNPVYPVLCDKLAVRDFIAARIGDRYHVPVLWIGAPADIPFDQLEPPYVIKSNHACGQVIMVAGRASLNPAAIRQTTDGMAGRALRRSYGGGSLLGCATTVIHRTNAVDQKRCSAG